MQAILDVVDNILHNQVAWIPILTFLFLQILKVAFSLTDLLYMTLLDVFITSGTELCVIAISIHFALLGSNDSRFFEQYPGENSDRIMATNLFLGIYIILTVFSFFFLKLSKDNIEKYKKISLSLSGERSGALKALVSLIVLIGFSLGLGIVSFLISLSMIG